MGQMKTPGVYIVEKNAFPNSVVEVATAVPAFIGYTRKAENNGKPLHMTPFRITSMSEFHTYFGLGPSPKFKFQDYAAPAKPEDEAVPMADFSFNNKRYMLEQMAGEYMLYNSMKLFFQNGGGPCYVVSVGGYDADVIMNDLKAGIETLIREQEPTMVVIPDAVLLGKDDCYSLYGQSLLHCSAKMKNRIALVDVWGGFKDDRDNACVANFREGVKSNRLDFASAYYPWVNTTIVQDSDLDINNIAAFDDSGALDPYLVTELTAELESNIPEAEVTDASDPTKAAEGMEALFNKRASYLKLYDEVDSTLTAYFKAADKDKPALEPSVVALHKSLMTVSTLYPAIIAEAKNKLNVLPPSAAMAGIYTLVDNSRGVWKAPANVSMASVSGVPINLSDSQQAPLNVDAVSGKSVNVIRTFNGRGTLIWGARTLDGNSNDWRYLSVRTTMIYLEQSCKLAAQAYVFEPNTKNTWEAVKAMISSFLTGAWNQGALQGAKASDAFSVECGLGSTMTSDDILLGFMNVTVKVAVVRPAEFIVITFQQQQATSS